jgi:hypothetical protein
VGVKYKNYTETFNWARAAFLDDPKASKRFGQTFGMFPKPSTSFGQPFGKFLKPSRRLGQAFGFYKPYRIKLFNCICKVRDFGVC